MESKFSFQVLASVLFLLTFIEITNAKKIQFTAGFQSYENIGKLSRPNADAQAVGAKLGTIGFTSKTTPTLDATRAEFYDNWEDFTKSIEIGDEVVVYLSGHGIEIDGQNYILPKDVPFKDHNNRRKITNHSIPIQDLIADVSKKQPSISIFIIDACRNDPFVPIEYALSPSIEKKILLGNAQGISPTTYNGHFTLYSARSGETSIERFKSNDASRYSLFTRHLLPLLSEKQISLTELARKLVVLVGEEADSRERQQTVTYLSGLDFRNINYCLAGCNEFKSAEPNAEDFFSLSQGSISNNQTNASLDEGPPGNQRSSVEDEPTQLATKVTYWELKENCPSCLQRYSNIVATQVQQILYDLGLNPGGVDGIWGSNSANAFAEFQKSVGLSPTGLFDDASLNKLSDARTRHLLERSSTESSSKTRENVGSDSIFLNRELTDRALRNISRLSLLEESPSGAWVYLGEFDHGAKEWSVVTIDSSGISKAPALIESMLGKIRNKNEISNNFQIMFPGGCYAAKFELAVFDQAQPFGGLKTATDIKDNRAKGVISKGESFMIGDFNVFSDGENVEVWIYAGWTATADPDVCI